jgi:DNA primase
MFYEAKYINTKETILYHKRETLFGIDLAKESIKKENNVYIVEGEFDVISPYQAGFTNFVAIKGSALTKEQLMFLKRYTERNYPYLRQRCIG